MKNATLTLSGARFDDTIPDTLDWVGNVLLFDDLQPGDALTLTFPVRETTARYTVAANTSGERVYTCTFRGSTCVDLSPRDDAPTNCPFYDRAALRTDRAPQREVERFVADSTAKDW